MTILKWMGISENLVFFSFVFNLVSFLLLFCSIKKILLRDDAYKSE